ncbi:MAG: DUF4198 domain-containing protein [Campylobacterota bacterium]
MKKTVLLLVFAVVSLNAHFLTMIPSTDYVSSKKQSSLKIESMFIHPFEQTGMQMVKPQGIFLNSKNKSLDLKEVKRFEKKAWTTDYEIKRPGVYKFFTIPKPYFESSEQKFISHVPKVIVSAYGYENGWDEPLGLDYEIIPLVKPFALYKGNLFQGKVLVHGKPASNVEVEVELYNKFGLKAPTASHITQVVKTNENGVFSFVLNHKGWWGFAALVEEGQKSYNDKMYPIENGALIWIKAY